MYDQRPLKKKMSITVDSDIEQAIKNLAEQDDRSFSQYINRVLRKHLVEIGYFDDVQKNKDK